MIELLRGDGPPLRIGHRGAAAIEPENTLRSFRAAVDVGVDLIEFDVLDLPRGPLVLAHSDDLHEVSHGAATGSVRGRTLDELREVAPELPTLDEALAFFVDEAPGVGLHVDLKLATRLEELVEALERHGLAGRTVVSSFHRPSLQAVARASDRVRIGFTFPEDRAGITRRRTLTPLIRPAAAALRATISSRVPSLLRRAGATTLMLHYAVVTAAGVARAHRLGAAVFAWTVDDPVEIERMLAAGVDGVITNDPRLLVATLTP